MSIPDYITRIKELIPTINAEDDPDQFVTELDELNARVQDLLKGDEHNLLELTSFQETISDPLSKLASKLHPVAPSDSDGVRIDPKSHNIRAITEKLAKVVSNTEQVFPHMKKFQEWMKMAKEDSLKTSINIEKEDSLSEEMRVRIAVAAAEQDPNAVLKNLQNYRIKDPNLLSKVALKVLENMTKIKYPNDQLFVKLWRELPIQVNEQVCYSMFKAYSNAFPDHIFNNLSIFPISQQSRYELVSQYIKENRVYSLPPLNELGIKDNQLRYKIIDELITGNHRLIVFNNTEFIKEMEEDQKLLGSMVEMLYNTYGYMISSNLFNYGFKDSLTLIKYAATLAESHPIHFARSISNWKDFSNPEVVYEVLKIILKTDPFELATHLKRFAKVLPQEKLYELTIAAIEATSRRSPGEHTAQIEAVLPSLHFDDVQKKLHCISLLLTKRPQNYNYPPDIMPFLINDPAIAKMVPYIQFTKGFDLKTAKINSKDAPNKPLGTLLETIKKLTANLAEGDKGYEKMLEWVIYLDLRTRGGHITEKQLQDSLPTLIQIAELRIPLMRYTVTDALFKNVYSPKPSAYESLGKILTEEHTHIMRPLLASLYELNPDADWDFIQILNDKGYQHFNRRNTILNTLQVILDNDQLEGPNKFAIFKAMMTCSDEKLKELKVERPKIPDRTLVLDQIETQLNLIVTLINSGSTKEIKGITKAEEIDKRIEEAMGIFTKGIDNFSQKYAKLIKELPPQKKMSLFIYSQCYRNYFPEHQEQFLPRFNEFLKNLVDGNFKKYRYGPNPEEDQHWAKVSADNPDLVQEWQKGGEFSCSEFGQSIEFDKIKKSLTRFAELDPFFKDFAFIPFVNAPALDRKQIDESIKELESKQIVLVSEKKTKSPEFMKIKLQIALLQLVTNKPEFKQSLLERIQSLYANIAGAIGNELNPQILAELGQLRETVGVKIDDKLRVVDTDDWIHLLLMGSMTKSCQSITETENNKALLSFIIDPSNRIITIVDENNQMVARAVTRLLIESDTGKKILFLEQIYTQASAPKNAREIILKAALARAEKLKIPLVGSKEYEEFAKKNYLNWLVYKGGRAPFHYVDAMAYSETEGTVEANSFNLDPRINKYLLSDLPEGEVKELKAA